MNELFETFYELVAEFRRCEFIDGDTMIHLRIFADTSGHIGREGNQTLYRYDYDRLEYAPVVWDNPEEGISMLEDCNNVITMHYKPFEWR